MNEVVGPIHQKICDLKKQGMAHRDISEEVWGVRSRASTVHYVLKKYGLVGDNNKNASKSLSEAPRILTLDIETAPLLGNAWGMWQQNIGLNMIIRDWYVLSWSAKWLDEEEVMYEDKRDSWQDEDDYEIIKSIHALIDRADILITQNGKKFDIKKLNSRFLFHGLLPPSSYRHIDTLQIAKRHFGHTSNTLAYMSDKFNTKYKKLKHGKFPGFELWKECQAGNLEAWEEMEEYNLHDVLATEELALKLAPWSNQIPNLDIYYSDKDNHCLCGSTEWEHNGYHRTNLSKFDRFACTNCGAEKRGRTNLLSKEKRATLKSNVV